MARLQAACYPTWTTLGIRSGGCNSIASMGSSRKPGSLTRKLPLVHWRAPDTGAVLTWDPDLQGGWGGGCTTTLCAAIVARPTLIRPNWYPSWRSRLGEKPKSVYFV
ncbi:hypothetical protein SERLA73DRAFT_190831, partial [Serpula lacrymans var. lacrymans S7.3]